MPLLYHKTVYYVLALLVYYVITLYTLIARPAHIKLFSVLPLSHVRCYAKNGKTRSIKNAVVKIKFRFRNKTFAKPIDKPVARVYNDSGKE